MRFFGWLALVGCVEALETAFDLSFEYEDPLTLQSTLDGSRFRWNTQSVVAGFGMEKGARMQLTLTKVETAAMHNGTQTPVVFTLYDIDQWRAYAVLKLREVHIRSDFVLCHYPAAMRLAVPPPDPEQNLPWTMSFDVRKPSLYTLQAQVCGEASVNITGYVSMVNLGYDGELSEHLGVQELGLRPLYKGTRAVEVFAQYGKCDIAYARAVLFAVYVAGMILWIMECYIWSRNVPTICYVFQAALQAKALSIALKIAFYSERGSLSTAHKFLDIAQDIGESATSAALLGVSVLGSLGWSLTRARLSRRELFSLALLAVVYLVVSVSKAMCRPTDAAECRGFLLSEYALQSMMMLGVIVALNFTIAQLKLAVNYERWNCFVTPLTYMKLDQFRRFRVVFLGYLLMPTFLLLLNLLVVTPPGFWRYAWVNTLLGEVTVLVIVVNIGLVVRPVDPYIYSRIARSTSSDAGNRESTDPIDPPPLETPLSTRINATNVSDAPAATPNDYLNVNPDSVMSGLAAIDSNR